MSASEPPGPDELADRFPITAVEAQAIADAMSPVQDIASAGASIGAAFENAPGAGPKLVGTVLQNVATHVDLVSNNAETVARAIDFYVTAQGGAVEDLFPPPDRIAQQLEDDAAPLVDLLNNPPGSQPP